MNRRHFVSSLGTLPFLSALAPGEGSPTPQRHGAGDFRQRFDLTLHRVLQGGPPAYTTAFLMEDVRGHGSRRFTNFSGDLSGRWIGALASCDLAPDASASLDNFVEEVVASQTTEGHFGKGFNSASPGDNDLALLWGNGRLLVGLLEYHRLRPSPKVLRASIRLGEFLLSIAPSFNSQGMADAFNASHFASSYICWTQQTEGLALLFAATGDQRFSKLCKEIALRSERRAADHVHGYLCSLRGALLLYEQTRDSGLLSFIETSHGSIIASGDLLLAGGLPEAWSPKRLRTEGCAECDWLRLNLNLWRVTGKQAYLDLANRTLFNEFAMNQFSTGDFGHGLLDGEKATSTVPVRAWWCCTLHGLRAFGDIGQHVFRSVDGSLSYDLPIDGAFRTPTEHLVATSTLSTDGKVLLKVHSASSSTTLRIAKPAWALTLTVTQNGKHVTAERPLAVVAGDLVSIHYGMQFSRQPVGPGGRESFWFGPWLLGIASFENAEFFNELHTDDTMIVSSLKHGRDTSTSAFAVPIAVHHMQRIPAEYPEQLQTAALRAVAEQTAHLPSRWQSVFRVQARAPGIPNETI